VQFFDSIVFYSMTAKNGWRRSRFDFAGESTFLNDVGLHN